MVDETMTPVEKGMMWERMSGEHLSDAQRQHLVAGGEFYPPGKPIQTTSRRPRPVTLSLLDDFENWTRTASMFLTSPEGSAFAEEMRAVINLARKGCQE